MAKLTTVQRKKIPTGKFALPKRRAYPIHDRTHAVNAKARAKQEFNKGDLSSSDLAKVNRAANKVLAKKAIKRGKK